MAGLKVKKKKMHQSLGDRTVSIVCYIFFSICAILCLYPFYYIFIKDRKSVV